MARSIRIERALQLKQMKRILLFLFVPGVFVFSPMLPVLDSNQISDYKGKLGNSDPAIRLAAIRKIGKLSENSPETAGNDVVPLFIEGLGDSDAKVHYEAVTSIAIISAQTMPRFEHQQTGIDLRRYPTLKPALGKLLFDPDLETKGNRGQATILDSFSKREKAAAWPGASVLNTQGPIIM